MKLDNPENNLKKIADRIQTKKKHPKIPMAEIEPMIADEIHHFKGHNTDRSPFTVDKGVFFRESAEPKNESFLVAAVTGYLCVNIVLQMCI